MKNHPRMRSTTILCVRRDGRLAMGGDGQVTMGENIVKQRARKIRRLLMRKSWRDLPGAPPTPSPFSPGLNRSSRSITET